MNSGRGDDLAIGLYNARLIRGLDVGVLASVTDNAGTHYTTTYPNISKLIRMENRNGQFYVTRDWYDARYRMLETPNTATDRFFVTGLDSVFVTTIAGNGTRGDVDGPALFAKFNGIAGLSVDDGGIVYLADFANHKIKRLTRGGIVETIAGTGNSGNRDGAALAAEFRFPITTLPDNAGNLFILELEGNRVRRLSFTAGTVTTFAGSVAGVAGDQTGTGTGARFNGPSAADFDSSGNLYIADRFNHKIKVVTPGGVVTDFAGTGNPGNADGPIANAEFNEPSDVAIGPGDIVYGSEVASRVRRISQSGSCGAGLCVETIAGTGVAGYVDGPGLSSQFGSGSLSGIDVDAAGNIYGADMSNHAIRQIAPRAAGFMVSTIAGDPSDGAMQFRDNVAGADARFWSPNGARLDGRGNLLVSELEGLRVRRIDLSARLTINGSQVGGRIRRAEDENWFEFVVTETADYNLVATRGSRISSLSLDLFGQTSTTDLYDAQPIVRWTGGNISHTRSLGPGTYRMRVSADPAGATRTGAFTVRVFRDPVALRTPETGNIEFKGDNDWFEFEITTGPRTTIIRTVDYGGLDDTYMYLYDSGSLRAPAQEVPVRLIAESGDDGAGGSMAVIRRTLASRRYWVRVRGETAADAGLYSFEIR